MDWLWRSLSALSGLGVFLCYLSGFLSLTGSENPFLLAPALPLFPLWMICVVASCYYGRNYSAEQFQRRCLYGGPFWVSSLVQISFVAFVICFA